MNSDNRLQTNIRHFSGMSYLRASPKLCIWHQCMLQSLWFKAKLGQYPTQIPFYFKSHGHFFPNRVVRNYTASPQIFHVPWRVVGSAISVSNTISANFISLMASDLWKWFIIKTLPRITPLCHHFPWFYHSAGFSNWFSLLNSSSWE